MHFHCRKSSWSRERRTHSFIRYVSCRSTPRSYLRKPQFAREVTQINPSILLPGKRDGGITTGNFKLPFSIASLPFCFFFFCFSSSALPHILHLRRCGRTSFSFLFATCSVWKRAARCTRRGVTCPAMRGERSEDIISIPIHYQTAEIL